MDNVWVAGMLIKEWLSWGIALPGGGGFDLTDFFTKELIQIFEAVGLGAVLGLVWGDLLFAEFGLWGRDKLIGWANGA